MRNCLLSTIAIGLYLLPTPLARAADEEPKALIEKAIKAYGGEEKLAGIKALRIKSKGNIDILGQNLTFTSSGIQQMTGQLKNEITVDIMGQQLTILQVYDGKKGWFRLMDATMELEGDLLKEMQAQAHSARVNTLVPLLKDKAFTLSPLGEVKVKGKAALGVKVSAKDQKDIELYFDKETGLMAKVARQAFDSNTMKEVMQEMIFSEFKETDGLKHATKVLMQHDGKKLLELDVTEYKLLDKQDDSEFAKP
jgi:hypothetical protein